LLLPGSMTTPLLKIRCLPEAEDGRKIPFELINENPLPDLPDLLREVSRLGIGLSQINLTLRADWLISGFQHLKEALRLAGELGVYVLLSSIGFESFDDTILRNLNKGLSVGKKYRRHSSDKATERRISTPAGVFAHRRCQPRIHTPHTMGYQ